ncbi:MAG TPA: hypothetical protein VNJ31_12155, partial [Methyloceanibacter sp.]|nr:hypothetical protein [Methyloceanibacter sp.]
MRPRDLSGFAPHSYRADPTVPAFPDTRKLIVFDGVCVLCSGFARFVASRLDRDGAGVTQVLVGFRVLGLTLPRTLWPKLEVREGADGTRYRFSIAVYFP